MSNLPFFRNHRKYQLLSWIKAFDDEIRNLSDYEPTASNLAYYLITECDYRETKLEEKYPHFGTRDRRSKIFLHVKRDITRRFEQFNSNIFEQTTVTKNRGNHVTLQKRGWEDLAVPTTAYYLSETGERQLSWLSDLINDKRSLKREVEEKEELSERLSIVDTYPALKEEYLEHFDFSKDEEIPVDEMVVPRFDYSYLRTEELEVPRIKLTEPADSTPTIDRSYIE